MIVDAATHAAIGGVWLDAALAPRSDFGRRAAARERGYAPGEEAQAAERARVTVAFATAFDAAALELVREAIRWCPDPTSIATRASAGDPLADVDFFELGRFVDALAFVRSQWPADAPLKPPSALDALAAALAPGRERSGFYLADRFDAELETVRRHAAERQAIFDSARSALEASVVANVGATVRDGEFILMRDRVSTALPPNVRVIREAATYLACELVYDERTLAALSARDAAHAAVARVEERARIALSAAVGAQARAIVAVTERLGEAERECARAAFARIWKACVPTYTTDTIGWEDATFPPLAEALAQRGRRYAPLSFAWDGVAVLTGPNMGGKTAAMQTAGFIALCAARGLPVPARAARVALVARIAWIGADDRDDRAGLLSAFGGEVVRARGLLAAHESTLALVDEFARTTSPGEGRALLVALVQTLATRGTRALVATHFDGIARDTKTAHLAIAGLRHALPTGAAHDLDAALAALGEAMDYRVIAVGPQDEPHADAIALAELLGLDPALIAAARAALRRQRSGTPSVSNG